MHKLIQKTIAVFVATSLLLISISFPAFAGTDDPSAGAMVADAFFLRPAGNVAMIVGGVLFVLTLPLSATGGNVKVAGQKMVKDPFKFSWQRGLGDF